MRKKRWVKAAYGNCPVRRFNDLKIYSLNALDASSRSMTMTLVELPPNKKLPAIRHEKTHEWIYVTEGSMTADLDGESISVRRGDYLYLPPKVWHSFKSGSKGVASISIYSPRLNGKKPDATVHQN